MLVIGVIDLLGGHAVHARAGDREKYAPVASVAGDALALARWYLETGVAGLYVADLNAILSRPPHDALVTTLAGLGSPVWLDAGVSSVERARHALTIGAARIVVGLETLASYQALESICNDAGRERVAFSLDLRDGVPMRAGRGIRGGEPAHVMARRAATAGAGTIIVLDLARVGTSVGVDVKLMKRVRRAVPDVTLVAGGGIRGLDDMTRLADAGCDGAIVATALHDGRLGALEIAALD